MSKRWCFELNGEQKVEQRRWIFLASLEGTYNVRFPVRVLLAQNGMVKPLWLLFFSYVPHGSNIITGIWDIRVSVILVISKLNYPSFGDRAFSSSIL